jgi:hypothetical protein
MTDKTIVVFTTLTEDEGLPFLNKYALEMPFQMVNDFAEGDDEECIGSKWFKRMTTYFVGRTAITERVIDIETDRLDGLYPYEAPVE